MLRVKDCKVAVSLKLRLFRNADVTSQYSDVADASFSSIAKAISNMRSGVWLSVLIQCVLN
jgi:hypothetical protein